MLHFQAIRQRVSKLFLLSLSLSTCVLLLPSPVMAAAAPTKFFEAHCQHCHDADTKAGEGRLLAFSGAGGKGSRGDPGICCFRHVVPQTSGHNWSFSSRNSINPRSRRSLTAVRTRGKMTGRGTRHRLARGSTWRELPSYRQNEKNRPKCREVCFCFCALSLPSRFSGVRCFQFKKVFAEVEVAGGTAEEMANYLWIWFSAAACKLT